MIKRSGREEVLHEVVEYDGILYICGLTAADDSLDMYGQTRQALASLDSLVKKHGSNRDRVMRVTIFITDMKRKPEMNRAWKEFFAEVHLPARATIGVSDLTGNILIEFVATAAVGGRKKSAPPKRKAARVRARR